MLRGSLLPGQLQVDGRRVVTALGVLALQPPISQLTREGAVLVHDENVTVRADHSVQHFLLWLLAFARVLLEASEALALDFVDHDCLILPSDRSAILTAGTAPAVAMWGPAQQHDRGCRPGTCAT